VKANLEGKIYRIFGYKGKQVRDNIHSLDVARFIEVFWKNPKVAAVYNIGGGRVNSVSILEAFQRCEMITGREMRFEYVESPRAGDHICYISDLTKIRSDYPDWGVTIGLDQIIDQIAQSFHGVL
jgi:CDP-paratose 2-epimerase